MPSGLVDQYGRPIAKRALTQTVANPTVGVRQAIDTNRILSGIDAKRLARVLRNAEKGNVYDLLTLAEEIERRDLHYSSVLSTRKLSVWGMPLRVDAVSDSAEHVTQADFVREQFKQSWFRAMLRELLDALAKGYSLVELVWGVKNGQWLPVSTEFVDPRWVSWLRDDPADPTNGRIPYLKTNAQPTNGEPIPGLGRGKFIFHRAHLRSGLPFRDGLMWPISVYFFFKNFGVRDWLAYAEVFGMPVRVGKHHPTATEKDVNTLKTAVSSIGSDAGAVIPDTMALEFLGIAGGSGGEHLYQRLCEWIDKQVSKGVLGQTMTVEDGSSLAQANIHEKVRQDLLQADAENLASTLQDQLIRPLIDFNFGEQQSYPRLKIGVEEREDLDMLARTLPAFINLGMRVSEAEIRDKFSLAEPDPDERILGKPEKEEVEQEPETAGDESPAA